MLLRHISEQRRDALTLPRQNTRRVYAVEQHSAAVGLELPRYQAEQGALPRSAAAGDENELALPDGEIYILNTDLITISGTAAPFVFVVF